MAASLLTPEMQKAICSALRKGLPVEITAELVGLSKVTIYSWLKKGGKGDPLYVDFLNAFKKARAAFVLTHLKRIADAAKEPRNWTAAAWLLERTRAEHFGKRESEILAAQEKRILALEEKLGKRGK